MRQRQEEGKFVQSHEGRGGELGQGKWARLRDES